MIQPSKLPHLLQEVPTKPLISPFGEIMEPCSTSMYPTFSSLPMTSIWMASSTMSMIAAMLQEPRQLTFSVAQTKMVMVTATLAMYSHPMPQNGTTQMATEWEIMVMHSQMMLRRLSILTAMASETMQTISHSIQMKIRIRMVMA